MYDIYSKNFPDYIREIRIAKCVYALHFPEVKMRHYGTYTCYGRSMHRSETFFFSTATLLPSGETDLN